MTILKKIIQALICILFLFFITSKNSISKDNLKETKIDSLLVIIKKQNEDTNKVNSLLNLGKEYLNSKNVQGAYSQFNYAHFLSKKLKFLNGERQACIYLSKYHNKLNNNYEELKSLHAALSISEKMNDKNKIAEIYEKIGSLYWNLKKIELAKKHFEMALKIYVKTENLKSLSWCYYYLGTLSHLSEINNAFRNFSMALKTARVYKKIITDSNDIYQANRLIGLIYNNIANVYNDKKDYESAFVYYDSSMTT